MVPALRKSTLQGLRLTVQDLEAATRFTEQVLGLQRDAADSSDSLPRFGLGAHWLALEQQPAEATQGLPPGNEATLHWWCSDLPRQSTHLSQLGFDSPNASTLDDACHVRIAAAETGACAIQWCDGPSLQPADPPASPGITALVLPARAPERAAAHWAQIFQMPLERHAAGDPHLLLDGIRLQFVFAEDGAGGVASLTLALDDAGAVRERAKARGLRVDGDTISLAGLKVRLAGAGLA